MLLFAFLRGGFSIHCHSANEEGVPAPSKSFMAPGEDPLGHKRPACMLLFAFLRGGLFYSLPLRERGRSSCPVKASYGSGAELELELELIQTQMAQKPMLRAEVGMRVRCANKASAE